MCRIDERRRAPRCRHKRLIASVGTNALRVTSSHKIGSARDMMQEESIDEVAARVRALDAGRKQAVDVLKQHARIPRNGAPAAFEFLEEQLCTPVAYTSLTGKVVAVDGGVVAEELAALDLLLVRACAVRFDYVEGKLSSHAYYPSAFPTPSPWAGHSLQSHEFNWAKNLKRLNAEIQCAIDACHAFEPDVLFLDGSIVPQVGDKPSRDSSIYPLYEDLIQRLHALYEWTTEHSCILAGVIKDSRGQHFLSLVRQSFPELSSFSSSLDATNDTTFLYSLLDPAWRTSAFKYAGATAEQLVLRDLGQWSKRLACLYVRAVDFDRPLRVDFLLPEGADSTSINRVASVVYSLSCNNRAYGYHAALIDAYLRAAIDGNEIDFSYHRLFTQAGWRPDVMQLRRNSRPFR